MGRPVILCCLVSCVTLAYSCQAQMVTTTAPLQTLSDSYYNNLNLSWGLRGPGWSFNFPGGNTFPAFGGGDPNAGLNGGFYGRSGNVSGGLAFNWGQGSSRSMGVTAPSVTTMNGQPGGIFSGTVRPFVTGITPVVGANQMNQAAMQQQAATLQDIAQRKLQSKQKKTNEYLLRAQRAEKSGNLRVARANYRLALSNAQEPLRSQILQRMAKYGWVR